MAAPRMFRQHRFQPAPGACEILLVRHGESAPMVEGAAFDLVDGHGDPHLHADGVAQAEQVAERLAATAERITAIYVTKLSRTQQTAAPLAARLGLEPVVDPDLHEVFLGDWEGGEFRRRVADEDPIAQQMYADQRWDVIPNGERAAEFEARVRRGLERIAAIYVTKLSRTQQTAAPLAARLGLEPVVDPDLHEVFLGDWEGGEFRRRVADEDPIAQQMYADQRWDVIPNGEPAAEFEARVRRGLERIAAAHPDELVVVVAHGGVIGQAMNIASGASGFTFTGAANASVTHLVLEPGRWVVRCYNDTGHLWPTFGAQPAATD